MKQRHLLEVALCSLLCHVFTPQFLAGADETQDVTALSEGFTINFNNVSLAEYLRFISKNLGVNFVYNEKDLQFNVTIISEEPISAKNLLSTLVQVLRIHDLALLEQEGNFLITSSKTVSQMPTLSMGEGSANLSPIVTRVLRVKNANIDAMAAILRPMVSQQALLEVSKETGQLIITDLTTNVEKIAQLLATLDAPQTALEIDAYEAKHVAPLDLIALTSQIVLPFTQKNTFLMVPQSDTNTIYLVSTPSLIERTLTILADLDAPSKGIGAPLSVENLLLYKVQLRPAVELLSGLKQIAQELQHTPAPPAKLIDALLSVRWIGTANALLFVSDSETLKKAKEIVADLDSPVSAAAAVTFYVYKLQRANAEQMQNALRQMAANLAKVANPDRGLIDAIASMQWIRETNSLSFTGDEASLKRLSELLPTFDVLPEESQVMLSQMAASNRFLIYHPLHKSGAEIEFSLREIGANLKASGLADPAFLHTLETLKWVASTNSILFTGDQKSLDHISEMLQGIDIALGEGAPAAPQGFFLYKLKEATGDAVLKNFNALATNLSQGGIVTAELVEAIRRVQWIKDTNSLMLSGTPEMLQQLKLLITDFDVAPAAAAAQAAKTSFYIYKPLHKKPQELEKALDDIAQDLEESGLIDSRLLDTIGSMRYVEASSSLLFTGSPDALDKVRELLKELDVAGIVAPIQRIGEFTFLIYKLQYVSADQLIASLKAVSSDLEKEGSLDKELGNAIHGMKWIPETNSILFTGPERTLQKVEELTRKFDIATAAPPQPTQPVPTARETAATSFILYTPRYQKGDELITILCDFQSNLVQAGVVDKGLFDTISSLKWIEKTNSLLISGDQPSIAKVQTLLERFDTPSIGGTAAPEIASFENTSFLVYKLQYHKGEEIRNALKQIATDLSKKGITANTELMEAIDSLQWITVTNSLLATGAPAPLGKLRELIQNLDIPLRQVFIEVLVLETNLTNTQNFGLQWGGKIQYLTKFAGATGNFAPNSQILSPVGTIPAPAGTFNLGAITATRTPLASDIPFSTGFDLGIIGDIIMHKGKSFLSLGSLVNALQTDTDSLILLNPKLIAQDNQNATVFIGQNIPFVGSLVTSTTSSQTTTSSLEYRDIGMSLSITPVIGNDGVVTLDIAQDISEVIGTPPILNSAQVSGIQTSHSTMNTRVQVPDNHFVVLSGMIQDTKTHFKSQIPCLGGLPVIGLAFSENDRVNSKSNIIFFLCPHIISTYKEYKELTEKAETLYKDAAVLPVLKEEIDAGIDMVKPTSD